MKKGLKSVILAIILIGLLLTVGCVDNKSATGFTSITLEEIGTEGDIRQKDIAYEITDNTELGNYLLAIKKEYLKDIPSETGQYSIIVSGDEYLFKTNPLNQTLLGVAIDETKSIDAIQKGTIKGVGKQENQTLSGQHSSARDAITI